MERDRSAIDRTGEPAERRPRVSSTGASSPFNHETRSDGDSDDEGVVLCLVLIMMAGALGQLDRRSLRCPKKQKVTVRSDFYAILRAQRSTDVYHNMLHCTPETFDALHLLLEPLYLMYGLSGKNKRFKFEIGLAVLLTYYGNGCGQDGDGIDGAVSQLGMSRTTAGKYINRIERLLFEMMHDVVSFPSRHASVEWAEMVDGFNARGCNFPDVTCVFDGTIVKPRRPKDHQGFYDNSDKPAYNYLACIDHRNKIKSFGSVHREQLRPVNAEPIVGSRRACKGFVPDWSQLAW